MDVGTCMTSFRKIGRQLLVRDSRKVGIFPKYAIFARFPGNFNPKSPKKNYLHSNYFDSIGNGCGNMHGKFKKNRQKVFY